MGLEHVKLVNLILQLTGVHLEDDKLYLLDSRLGEIMRKYDLSSWNQVAEKLQAGSDKEFVNAVVDKITTHETRFFRDESIFDGLVMQIIPEWMKRNNVATGSLLGSVLPVSDTAGEVNIGVSAGMSSRKLSIWSAACSTGQEPYSMAMLLNEKMPLIARMTTIYATDISEDTIRKAQDGIYSKFEIGRGLPDLYLNKYFKKLDDNKYQLSESIRSRVKFATHNLIKDVFPAQNDIVLCRNVSIYFTEAQKKILYGNLRKALTGDGVLILGSAESLSGYIENFIIREFGLSRYYEMNASQVFMF